MLKKRVIGSIIVKNGWAVQSIGYESYLPLGRPEILAENLDRWGADEIIIQCIDRSKGDLGPDFDTIECIASKGITTPLIYAGGISSYLDCIEVIKSGADRIAVDEMLRSAPSDLKKAASILGSQAIVGCLPIGINGKNIMRLNYLSGELIDLDKAYLNSIYQSSISELLLIDFKNEGRIQGSNLKALDLFPTDSSKMPLLYFGGINTHAKAKKVLNKKNVAGVVIGNYLSYKENSIGEFKQSLNGSNIRSHIFQSAK